MDRIHLRPLVTQRPCHKPGGLARADRRTLGPLAQQGEDRFLGDHAARRRSGRHSPTHSASQMIAGWANIRGT